MRTKRQNFLIIVILGILNALTPFTIDLYLPAFPEIAADLNTNLARVAFTISIYFIGFALGQLIYGPLMDRFGRKPPVYAGIILYIVATIGCARAQSIEELILFRLISALGGSATSVGTTAMVRDYFPAKDGAKVFSFLMLVLSASPLLAPSIGSLVILHYDWRMLFWILVAFAVIDFLMVAFLLPRGYEPDLGVKLRIKPIAKNFIGVLRVESFTVNTLAGALSFAGLFVYVAGSPAIFMDGFHVSAQTYGAIFAFLAAGMIGGGQLNLLLMKKWGSKRVFEVTLGIQVMIAAMFFIGSLGPGYNLPWSIAFLFSILSCAGIAYPNAAALALEPFTKNVGSASSLLGFIQLSVGAFASAGVGFLDIKGTLSTAAVMSISATLGFVILLLSRKSRFGDFLMKA